MAGKIVRTVLGDIAPEELGFTSLHDHTFLDMRQAGAFLEQMFPDVTQDQVAFVPENFTYLKTGTFLINHDLQIVDDIDELVSEYGHFRDLGGRSIFDAAPIGIRGNVCRIAELSRRVGINIVVATGFYHEATIPPEHLDKGEDHFYDCMRDEIEHGIDGTEIRPGGLKCALSYALDNEVAAVNAAVRLSAETGMSCHVHTEPTLPADDLVDTLESAVGRYGADRSRIVVCHMDNRIAASVVPADYLTEPDTDRTLDLDLQRDLLSRGYNIGLDTWCLPLVNYDFFMPDLYERTKALITLCDEGYAGQISLGNDFSGKICMRAYGGYGPCAFEEFGLMMLERVGKGDYVHTLVNDNPARILAF